MNNDKTVVYYINLDYTIPTYESIIFLKESQPKWRLETCKLMLWKVVGIYFLDPRL